MPVAQTFFMDDDVRAKTELDAVVALVDAKHLPLRLKDSREAEDQIAFADVVLLNKTDLVTPEELERVEATVRVINPSARIYRTQRSEIDLAKVLDQGAFNLDRALENDPHFLDHDDHDHVCGPIVVMIMIMTTVTIITIIMATTMIMVMITTTITTMRPRRSMM